MSFSDINICILNQGSWNLFDPNRSFGSWKSSLAFKYHECLFSELSIGISYFPVTAAVSCFKIFLRQTQLFLVSFVECCKFCEPWLKMVIWEDTCFYKMRYKLHFCSFLYCVVILNYQTKEILTWELFMFSIRKKSI